MSTFSKFVSFLHFLSIAMHDTIICRTHSIDEVLMVGITMNINFISKINQEDMRFQIGVYFRQRWTDKANSKISDSYGFFNSS